MSYTDKEKDPLAAAKQAERDLNSHQAKQGYNGSDSGMNLFPFPFFFRLTKSLFHNIILDKTPPPIPMIIIWFPFCTFRSLTQAGWLAGGLHE